jgi:hypothetical protein
VYGHSADVSGVEIAKNFSMLEYDEMPALDLRGVPEIVATTTLRLRREMSARHRTFDQLLQVAAREAELSAQLETQKEGYAQFLAEFEKAGAELCAQLQEQRGQNAELVARLVAQLAARETELLAHIEKKREENARLVAKNDAVERERASNTG